jgi:tetratricopeptide (TPR) repeat protein
MSGEEIVEMLGLVFFLLVGLAILVLVLHFYWFEVLPGRIIGDTLGSPEICRKLERVAAMPTLLGESRKVRVRFDLLRLLNHWGQPERALEHARRILECRIPPSLEADVRIRMADALESLGRLDEAREQRLLAKAGQDEDLDGKDSTWFLNRGRILESQRDFDGACANYARAVQIMPPGNDGPRSHALVHLALAEFHAGRIEDSAQHAAQAAELATSPKTRHSALRQASAAYATLGQIEQSEKFDRMVREEAMGCGDLKAVAEASAHLAENLRKRGRLGEALESIDEAARIEDVRSVHSVRYEILRSSGRYEEALEAIDAARRTGQFGLARHEKKIQGLYDFSASRVLMDLGRIDEAEACLTRAMGVLKDDPKLHLWCLAGMARAMGAAGSRPEAVRLIERVEAGLPAFRDDRNTLQVGYASIGRSALALGDFERALKAWRSYLDTNPSPVDQPTALFHVGECCRGLGNREAARDAYQAAISLGIETPEAARAFGRLEERWE